MITPNRLLILTMTFEICEKWPHFEIFNFLFEKKTFFHEKISFLKKKKRKSRSLRSLRYCSTSNTNISTFNSKIMIYTPRGSHIRCCQRCDQMSLHTSHDASNKATYFLRHRLGHYKPCCHNQGHIFLLWTNSHYRNHELKKQYNSETHIHWWKI